MAFHFLRGKSADSGDRAGSSRRGGDIGPAYDRETALRVLHSRDLFGSPQSFVSGERPKPGRAGFGPLRLLQKIAAKISKKRPEPLLNSPARPETPGVHGTVSRQIPTENDRERLSKSLLTPLKSSRSREAAMLERFTAKSGSGAFLNHEYNCVPRDMAGESGSFNGRPDLSPAPDWEISPPEAAAASMGSERDYEGLSQKEAPEIPVPAPASEAAPIPGQSTDPEAMRIPAQSPTPEMTQAPAPEPKPAAAQICAPENLPAAAQTTDPAPAPAASLPLKAAAGASARENPQGAQITSAITRGAVTALGSTGSAAPSINEVFQKARSYLRLRKYVSVAELKSELKSTGAGLECLNLVLTDCERAGLVSDDLCCEQLLEKCLREGRSAAGFAALCEKKYIDRALIAAYAQKGDFTEAAFNFLVRHYQDADFSRPKTRERAMHGMVKRAHFEEAQAQKALDRFTKMEALF